MMKKLIKVLPYLLILGLIIAEGFMIFDVWHQKQRSEFISLVGAAESEVDAIESSINNGNQKLYDETTQRLANTTIQLTSTPQGQELAALVKSYSSALDAEKESISEVILINSAYNTFQSEIQTLPTEITTDNAKEYLNQLKTAYTAYRTKIENSDLKLNQTFKTETITNLNKLLEVTENISSCINVCYKSSYEQLNAKLSEINRDPVKITDIDADSSTIRAKIKELKE